MPVLIAGAGAGEAGLCAFVDVAATIATHLRLSQIGPGRSLL
jgi:phosphopentomutase